MNVSCTSCQTVFRVDPVKVPAAGVRARCSECGGVFWVRRESDVALPEERPVAAAPDLAPSSPPEPAPKKAAEPPVGFAPPVVAPPADRLASPPPRPGGRGGPLGPAVPVAPTGRTIPETRPPAPAIARPAQPRPEPVVATKPAAPPPPISGPFAAKPVTPEPPVSPTARGTVAASTAPAKKRRVNPFLSQSPESKARRLARALISDMVVYHPAKRREGLEGGDLKTLFEEEIRKSWEEYVDQVGQPLADSTPFFNEALNEILADGQSLFP